MRTQNISFTSKTERSNKSWKMQTSDRNGNQYAPKEPQELYDYFMANSDTQQGAHHGTYLEEGSILCH